MLLKTCSTEEPMSRTCTSQPRHTVVDGPHKSTVRRPRVAFYSHDTMGLGHLRRNLLIAGALADRPVRAEVLIISGAREAAFFTEQASLDCVTLPALHKDLRGQYSARNLDWSMERIVQFRSRIIAAAIEEFQPDIFVVDKVPRGIGNELDPVLEKLRHESRTRCVLGLRDVLDEPAVVNREWKLAANDDAVERYFDELWIYGDQAVYDTIAEYDFASCVADRAKYTGFLNQARRLPNRSAECCTSIRRSAPPSALCVVGGGQDGFQLAADFISGGVPDGWTGAVITGPYMPAAQKTQLRRMSAERPTITVIDQLVETDEWLRSADRVIAMGGYNTVTSVLSHCKPALIVPRVQPRREQWIRADRLRRLGCISILPPSRLGNGELLRWMQTEQVPIPKVDCVNLNGLQHICSHLGHLHR
jgi:predicted glycosyltransferase